MQRCRKELIWTSLTLSLTYQFQGVSPVWSRIFGHESWSVTNLGHESLTCSYPKDFACFAFDMLVVVEIAYLAPCALASCVTAFPTAPPMAGARTVLPGSKPACVSVICAVQCAEKPNFRFGVRNRPLNELFAAISPRVFRPYQSRALVAANRSRT
jgi:hypothetical protein